MWMWVALSRDIGNVCSMAECVHFAQFLAKLHLMDYSLLVGIHDRVRAEEEALHNENATRESGAGGGRETSESEECDSGER